MAVTMRYGTAGSNPVSSSGSTWELLWENSDPTASFAAQTVSLDLSGYDMVAVFQRLTTSTDTSSMGFCKVGESTLIYTVALFTSPNYMQIRSRSIDVSSTGVTFGKGGYHAFNSNSYSENNSHAIPTEIYGIKF